MTTYTIAYSNDLILACLPDGGDIAVAVAAEAEKIGCDLSDYGVESGLTLTNDDSLGVVIFRNRGGVMGDMLGFDYAVAL